MDTPIYTATVEAECARYVRDLFAPWAAQVGAHEQDGAA